MKKIILMFLMMLMPIYMSSTSVTSLYYKWDTQQRTLSSSVNLAVRNGNVVLSSRGIIQDAEIVITNVDGTMLKFYSYSSSDSPMEVLSEDEIPEEGCYVKISHGGKYVLYHVTKD